MSWCHHGHGVTDSLYRRAADLLVLDEAMLNSNTNAEGNNNNNNNILRFTRCARLNTIMKMPELYMKMTSC